MNQLAAPRHSIRGENPEFAGKRVIVGRIQKQIRRAFVASTGQPLVISELLARCYPAAKQHPRWHRWSIHRALPKYGVALGRSRRQGRPIVWAPRPELARLIGASADYTGGFAS